MNDINRKDTKSGIQVSIVLKQDQRTGKLTEGIVKDILTNHRIILTGLKSSLRMVVLAGARRLTDNNYT